MRSLEEVKAMCRQEGQPASGESLRASRAGAESWAWFMLVTPTPRERKLEDQSSTPAWAT